MHVIVVGCGRVGASLAGDLDEGGHTVVVVDQDESSFRRLPPRYAGATTVGVGFDRTALLRSGIDEADALVAVTSGDNSNIVAARIARDRFGVRRVIARIYDADRARIYERHGITTIASARWTTDAILGHLSATDVTLETTIGPGEGDVVVLAHDLPSDGGPWEIETFQRQGSWVPAAITRVGQTTIPVPRQLVQAGERVHLAVQRSVLDEAKDFLRGLATNRSPQRSGRQAGSSG